MSATGWRRVHAVMTIAWFIAIIPTLLWWRESVLWVALMSCWANAASHFSAWQGSRAEEQGRQHVIHGKFEVRGEPGRATLHLDGTDISATVRRYSVEQDIRTEFPRVELELLLGEAVATLDQPVVAVSRETHDLLVNLGWTPPST